MAESMVLTGVDKLVDLINKKERVSLKDATTELKVGPEVITEWAEFLEDEGIISIEYKFATPFFVKRKMTEKEVEEKAQKFNLTKDSLVRKAESLILNVDLESAGFKKIKDEFDKLKKELGEDMSNIKEELQEFEKYSEFKKNLDKKMLADQNTFQQKLVEIHREVEQKNKEYDEAVRKMSNEELALQTQRKSSRKIAISERMLKKRLDDAIARATAVSKQLDDKVQNSEKIDKHMREMIDYIEGLKTDIEKKKQAMLKPLMDQSEEYKKRIAESQQAILSKVKENRKEMDDDIKSGKAAAAKFKEFFEKRAQIDKMISEIDEEKRDLDKEIMLLINHAKTFHLGVRESDFKGHAKDLEQKLKEIERKKSIFEIALRKLSSMLKPGK